MVGNKSIWMMLCIGLLLLSGSRAYAETATAPLNGTVSFTTGSATADTLNVDSGSKTVKAKDAVKIQGHPNSRITVVTVEGTGTVHVADVILRDGDSLYRVTGTYGGSGGSGGGGGPSIWTADYNKGAGRILLAINTPDFEGDNVVPFDGTSQEKVALIVRLGGVASPSEEYTVELSDVTGTGTVDFPREGGQIKPVKLGKVGDVVITEEPVLLSGTATGPTTIRAKEKDDKLTQKEKDATVVSVTKIDLTLAAAKRKYDGQASGADVTANSTDREEEFKTSPRNFKTFTRNCGTIQLAATADLQGKTIKWIVEPWEDHTGDPALSKDNEVNTTCNTDGRGAYRIRAFVDTNSDGKMDKTESGIIFRVCLVDITLIKKDVEGNKAHIANKLNHPSWVVVGTGAFGAYKLADVVMLGTCEADVLGGGADKKLGIDAVHIGWINNLTGHPIRGRYQDAVPNTSYVGYGYCGNTGALTEPWYSAAPPGASLLPAAPTLPSGWPLLDTGRANPGDGGSNVFLTRSQANDTTKVRRTVLVDDSPGFPFPVDHPNNGARKLNQISGDTAFALYLSTYSTDAPHNWSIYGKADWTMHVDGAVARNGAGNYIWTDSGNSAVQIAKAWYQGPKAVDETSVEIGTPTALRQMYRETRGADGSLEVVSVTGPQGVKPGDVAKTITVRVRNPSSVSDIRVKAIVLKMSIAGQDKTAEYTITAGPNPALPRTIAAGAHQDFEFTISIGAAATPGNVTVDALADGENAQGPISDSDGATTKHTMAVVKVNAVTMTPTEIKADGTATSTASATTVPEGRTLTWSIVGEAKGCTVVDGNKVKAGTEGGTITVRATDATGATSDGTLTLVKVSNVTTTPASIPANGTATSTCSATTAPEGRNLTWSIVGDAKGCTIVDGNTVKAGQQAGQITVRATDAPTGATADGTLTLTQP